MLCNATQVVVLLVEVLQEVELLPEVLLEVEALPEVPQAEAPPEARHLVSTDSFTEH